MNYFDTPRSSTGNGESEKNIGRVLRKAQTRQTWSSAPRSGLADRRFRSHWPTPRQGRSKAVWRDFVSDRVDIFHLHNAITETGGARKRSASNRYSVTWCQAFERLRQQGKTRFLGLTAVGDTAALHQMIDARAFDSAQVVYNMLNPSAAAVLPVTRKCQWRVAARVLARNN